MNVIIVDWGHGAVPPYTEAAANTRVVGAQAAKLISVMVKEDQSGIDKFHLIGHSLGAHVAGYAGERNEEVLSNGNTMTNFFTTNKDIGNVTAVALRYDKTANLMLGWAYPNEWSLMGLSLLEAEKHRM
ncbi:Hypothetical predicted protein [Mytilus galloprovincialis]|uniref:Lipase domain-containing protein n=1 Tax=Mytilus galloprovincialis TaxID=29158 RepID=A0A8B6CNS3_MYTGA|nr:Hypothetical predicted protein [Mytilus galloprovincialis]